MDGFVAIGIYEAEDEGDGWQRMGEREVRAGSVSYFEPFAGNLFRARMLDGSTLVTDADGKAIVVAAAAAEH